MASLYNLPMGSGKCEYLFEAAKKRKQRRDSVMQCKVDENCTFRPDIGVSQRKVRSRSPVKLDVGCGSDCVVSAELKKAKKLDLEQEQALKLQGAIRLYENIPVEKHKVELHKKIFQLLDSDSDNVISSKKIDISSSVSRLTVELSIELLKLYKPVFNEMEQSDQVLTLENFIAASENLYSKLSKADRELFLKNSSRECTFKVSSKRSECSRR